MEETRMPSQEDIKQVQELIELCIQQDMTREDTVTRISERQKQFTAVFVDLVWMRLEEENRDFFEAYHLRLMLKRQILQFNNLLKRHSELMNQIQSSEPPRLPVSDGSNVKPTVQRSSDSTAIDEARQNIKPQCFHPVMPSGFPSAYSDGVMHPGQSILSFPSGNRGPVEPSTASCDMRIIPSMNGGTVKSESCYTYGPQPMIRTNGIALERHPNIGDASVACFYDVPYSQTLNEQFCNLDMSSALLEQPPRSLPFSEFPDFPSFLVDSNDFLITPDENHKFTESWSY
ncbi:hypothetical protein Dimus_002133 [Dionaea muscipula]